jgi:hypothetical protein
MPHCVQTKTSFLASSSCWRAGRRCECGPMPGPAPTRPTQLSQGETSSPEFTSERLVRQPNVSQVSSCPIRNRPRDSRRHGGGKAMRVNVYEPSSVSGKRYGCGGAFMCSGFEPSPARLGSKKCGIGRTYKNDFRSSLCPRQGLGAGLFPCPRRPDSHTAYIAKRSEVPSPSAMVPTSQPVGCSSARLARAARFRERCDREAHVRFNRAIGELRQRWKLRNRRARTNCLLGTGSRVLAG